MRTKEVAEWRAKCDCTAQQLVLLCPEVGDCRVQGAWLLLSMALS